jgi:hypothetical protein
MRPLIEAPLHGGASYRPTIGPLDYRDARKLAPSESSPQELIERHAVVGGLLSSRDAIAGRTADARLVLFARRGFTKSLQRRAEREDVLLVTVADLFA